MVFSNAKICDVCGRNFWSQLVFENHVHNLQKNTTPTPSGDEKTNLQDDKANCDSEPPVEQLLNKQQQCDQVLKRKTSGNEIGPNTIDTLLLSKTSPKNGPTENEMSLLLTKNDLSKIDKLLLTQTSPNENGKTSSPKNGPTDNDKSPKTAQINMTNCCFPKPAHTIMSIDLCPKMAQQDIAILPLLTKKGLSRKENLLSSKNIPNENDKMPLTQNSATDNHRISLPHENGPNGEKKLSTETGPINKHELALTANSPNNENGLSTNNVKSRNGESPLPRVKKDSSETFNCKLCGEFFNGNFLFYKHLKSHDIMTLKSSNLHNGAKALTKSRQQLCHKCKLCDLMFDSRMLHKKHNQSVHGKQEFFKCKMCDKIYTTPTTLKMHVKTAHDGIRAFECGQCDQKFRHKLGLQLHVRDQ